jgi:hypothetical protein
MRWSAAIESELVYKFDVFSTTWHRFAQTSSSIEAGTATCATTGSAADPTSNSEMLRADSRVRHRSI